MRGRVSPGARRVLRMYLCISHASLSVSACSGGSPTPNLAPGFPRHLLYLTTFWARRGVLRGPKLLGTLLGLTSPVERAGRGRALAGPHSTADPVCPFGR